MENLNVILFKQVATGVAALLLSVVQVQDLQAQELYKIDKTKILMASKEHIAAVLPQVDKNALVFRGFTYINRPKTTDADRLQVEYCWGAKVTSSADMFDIFDVKNVKSKDTGYFTMVSVDVSAEGAIDNAKIEKVLLSSTVEGDPCLTAGAK